MEKNIAFSNKFYKIKLSYVDCPTQTNKWIFITNYKKDKRKFLFVDKKIIKNKKKYNKNRNIFLFELPKFSIHKNKYIYNNKEYTTVYFPSKDTQSHFSFLIFDENQIENEKDNKIVNNLDYWFDCNLEKDVYYQMIL